MIISDIDLSSVNKVNAKVELYSGSTLVTTCTCEDRLQDFSVERMGQNNKFFGFGIFHKLTVHLIDLDRDLTVTKDNSFKVHFGGDDTFVIPYPTFYAEEITRDETTNTIKVVAYDKLYATNNSTISDLALSLPYTVEDVAKACSNELGITEIVVYDPNLSFHTSYPTGANFEGTEGCKDVLNAVAEVTQTIYYLNNADQLVFKLLDKDGLPKVTISKNDYYTLVSGEKYKLGTITNTTELGDATSATIGEGYTQFVRDNPFWELREDLPGLLDEAIYGIGGIEASQFSCDWDGNFLLEPGDKIALITEDDQEIYSYMFNSVISYAGYMAEITEWTHEDREETAENPTNLGDALKQTFAKVDKANKEITLVASDVSANTEAISELKITTDGIVASVNSLTTRTETLEGSVDGFSEDMTELTGIVNGHSSSIDSINGTISTHTEEIGALELTTEGLSASVGTLTTKTEELAAKDTAIDGSISEINAKVTTNTTDISSLKLTTDELSASVGTLTTKTEELTQKDTDLEGNLTEINNKVTTNTEDIGELKLTTEAFEVRVGNVETKTEEITTKTTTLEGSVNELSTKVTTNTEKIGQLEVNNESITASVSRVEAKVDTTAKDLSDLDDRVVDLDVITANHTERIGKIEIREDEITASVSKYANILQTVDETVAAQGETIETHTSQISSLEITVDGIVQKVEEINVDGLGSRITSLETRATGVEIEVQDIQDNGVSKVVTSTGFTFNENGLTIEQSDSSVSTNIDNEGLTVLKSGSEVLVADKSGVKAKDLIIVNDNFTLDSTGLTYKEGELKTTIDMDGLTVYRNSTRVLDVDSQGVRARDLKATTYITLGNSTYFEEYTDDDGNSRVGCFWMGN